MTLPVLENQPYAVITQETIKNKTKQNKTKYLFAWKTILRLFVVWKNDTPSTGKSTLCHYSLITQQTKISFCTENCLYASRSSACARHSRGSGSLETTMICFPIHCQPWCAFWQKNDMVFQLILLTYSEKHIIRLLQRGFKNPIKAMCPWDDMLLFVFGSDVLFTIDQLRSISFFLSKCTSRLANKKNTYQTCFQWVGVGGGWPLAGVRRGTAPPCLNCVFGELKMHYLVPVLPICLPKFIVCGCVGGLVCVGVCVWGVGVCGCVCVCECALVFGFNRGYVSFSTQ